MTIDIKKGSKNVYFSFSFDFDWDLQRSVLRTPSIKYHRGLNTYIAPATIDTATVVLGFVDQGWTPTKEALEVASDLLDKKADIQEIREAIADDLEFPIKSKGFTPKNYQVQDALLMAKMKKCLNANDMGLGKTLQTIMATHLEEAFPCLIVCRKSVASKWRADIKRWNPGLTVNIYGSVKESQHSNYEIINYERVVQTMFREVPSPTKKKKFEIRGEYLNRYKCIVIDESHAIKNQTSNITKCMKKLSKMRSVTHVYLLSGTPIEIRPRELIPQLFVIDKLNEFGGQLGFMRKFCGMKKTPFGIQAEGATNMKELNRMLLEKCMIRRLKEEVSKEFPKLHAPVVVGSDFDSPEQREKYHWIEENIDEYIEECRAMEEAIKREKHETPLFGITDEEFREIKKFKSNTKFESVANELQKLSYLRSYCAENKTIKSIEYIERIQKHHDGKVVVFAHSRTLQREVLLGLREKGYVCMSIFAEDSAEDRLKKTSVYNSDNETIFAVCSLIAANSGIDLVGANAVVFLDVWYNPKIHAQAVDRLHRIGQKKDVYPYWIILKNTVQHDIWRSITKAENVVDQVTDGFALINQKDIIDESFKMYQDRVKKNAKQKIDTL